MFVHIKGKHNISRLKMLSIYKDPLENPKAQVVKMHNRLLQKYLLPACKPYKMICSIKSENGTTWIKKLAWKIHHSNKNSSSSLTLSAYGALQKHQYVHDLQHDVTIAQCLLIPTILHEFHDFKGHQETICMFEAVRRFYWWPNYGRILLSI